MDLDGQLFFEITSEKTQSEVIIPIHPVRAGDYHVKLGWCIAPCQQPSHSASIETSSYLNAIVKLLPFITPRATEVHLNAPQMPDKLPSWFDTVEE